MEEDDKAIATEAERLAAILSIKEEDKAAVAVMAVSGPKVNLPTYMPEDVEYWLATCDGMFDLWKNADGTPAIDDAMRLTLLTPALPAHVRLVYKKHVLDKDYAGFKTALIGAVKKTDAILFDECVSAKHSPHQTPSQYCQELEVKLKMVEQKDLMKWFIKHSLERSMPLNVRSTMSSDEYGPDYLKKVDKVYANQRTPTTVSSVETMVASLEKT